jgi:glycosyltransferase involved in cell wall biosynthesis
LNSILVLSPTLPYPPQSGGDIRLFELLRRLAIHFDLHLLAYGSGQTDEFIQQSGVKSVTLILGGQPAPSGGYLRKKLDLWRESPHGLRLDVDPVFARVLKKTLLEIKPQSVLIEHVYMIQYHKFFKNLPVFISCYDVETTKIRRWFAGDKTNWLKKLRQGLQLQAMRRCESNLGRLAHTIFTTSEVDTKELQQMNRGGQFVCVPNGADLKTFTLRSPDTFHGPPMAFFVGSLFYKPNLDAAMMLKTEIWPLVRHEIPNAVCHIAGNPGGLDLHSLNDPNEGVLFHGLVPDIRPYLTMSQAMVVPLRVGSGTRIKIIESMATGTPVVSTEIGAEGINCTHNKNILLADTVEELAKSAINLLRDRQAAYRIGRAGHYLVKAQYNWDRSAQIMCEVMQTAIPRPLQ